MVKRQKIPQIGSSHASIRKQLVKLREIVNNFSIFAFFCPLHSFVEFYHLPFIHSFSKLQHVNPVSPHKKSGTFTRRVCWSYMTFVILAFAYRILGKMGVSSCIIFALWLSSHWYSLHISVSSFFFCWKEEGSEKSDLLSQISAVACHASGCLGFSRDLVDAVAKHKH